MPGACGAPELQPRSVAAPAAASAPWLAVSFHCCESSSRGSEASSSGRVHGVLRPAVSARTRATSAGVTMPPLLPKLLRTYDAMPATHSSVPPIGTITSR